MSVNYVREARMLCRSCTLLVSLLFCLSVNSDACRPLSGYIESAEQSRMAEQNKISKLTVKLQIISTEHGCRM